MKQLREGNGETDNGFKCRKENRKGKLKNLIRNGELQITVIVNINLCRVLIRG